MRFRFELTVPADTAQSDPAEAEARLVRGTLRRIQISFPPGPSALVHVVVLDKLLQIAPVNPEESFAWDDLTFAFDMDYGLTDRGHLLTLQGWSPDTYYDHTVTFGFDVEPAAAEGERGVIERLAQLLGLPGR